LAIPEEELGFGRGWGEGIGFEGLAEGSLVEDPAGRHVEEEPEGFSGGQGLPASAFRQRA